MVHQLVELWNYCSGSSTWTSFITPRVKKSLRRPKMRAQVPDIVVLPETVSWCFGDMSTKLKIFPTRFHKIVRSRIPRSHLAHSQWVMMTMRYVAKEHRGPGYTRSTALRSLRLKPHTRHWVTKVWSGLVTLTLNVGEESKLMTIVYLHSLSSVSFASHSGLIPFPGILVIGRLVKMFLLQTWV